MLLGGRRNRAYFFRWFYAAWILLLLLGFLTIHLAETAVNKWHIDPGEFANFAREFLEYLVLQHYWVLLIATPVLTAGAITDEKWRGTLQYLLVTDMLPWEILTGKLIGRLYQVFLIALTPLPLICFIGVFGGLDLLMLLSISISSLVMAFALGSMSLLASVQCRHTRDAVLSFYTVGGLLFFAAVGLQSLLASLRFKGMAALAKLLEIGLNCLNPLHPMGTGWALDDPVERTQRVAAAVAAWGFVGVVSLVLASLRLRGCYLLYLEHGSRVRWRPIILVFLCGWTLAGLILVVPLLLAAQRLIPYLKGTTSRPWATDLALFLLAWMVLGLVPLLAGIAWLLWTRRSQAFLRRLQTLWQASWFTRRAKIGRDPIAWKERCVEGIAPLAALRAMPRWLGMALIFFSSSLASVVLLSSALSPQHDLGTVVQLILDGDLSGLMAVRAAMDTSSGSFWGMGFVVLFVASLVVAIRSSGAVTGEREKNTWEALLLTPLEARELVRGKLWGIFGASLPYVAAYAVPALVFATIGGFGTVFWTALPLGVTLLAMWFVGAAGIWCSVLAKTSWRSLLGTLGITYIGGFVLFCVSSYIMLIVAVLVMLALMLVEAFLENKFGVSLGIRTGGGATFLQVFMVAMCLTLAVFFNLLAWGMVGSAEYRVGVLERTKHWRNEDDRRWYGRGRKKKAAVATNARIDAPGGDPEGLANDES
jgi:ABC-type transport system involved in multi-copper enzyme maturation permease subunit